MDIEQLQFIGFPKTVSNTINYCTIGQNFNAKINNNTNISTLSNINQSFQSHIKYFEWNDSSINFIDPNCPGLHTQSTVAHISMAVASITMLIHIIIVITINSGLIKLYGPCILICISFNSLHSACLFFSAYIPSKLTENSNISNYFIIDQYHITCWFIDCFAHYLILSIHLSIFLGLIERNQFMNNYLHNNKLLNRSKLNSHKFVKSYPNRIYLNHKLNTNHDDNKIFLDKQSEKNQRSNNNENSNFLCNKNYKRKNCFLVNQHETQSFPISSNHERKTRFVIYKETSNNQSIFNSHLNSKTHVRNWNLTILLTILFTPLLPISMGIWATIYTNLDSMWNPAYGLISCGNIGNCIAPYQWFMHIPIGLMCFGDIILITVIVLRTDINCFAQSQFSSHYLDDERARFRMLTKMAISHLIVWISAICSNFICHPTLWQLYTILTALQSLYLFMSFAFSRPFLELIFKRDDPLARLKLDTLAMQLPIGTLRSRDSTTPTTIPVAQ